MIKYFSYASFILAMLLSIMSCNEKPGVDIILTGDYLGQAPPDTLPSIFAPGVISDGYANRDMAIHPNGDKIFYSILLPKRSGVLMQVNRKNDIWNKPIVAPFSGKYSDIEPCFSYDGKRLYFASNRPLKDDDPPKDYDIWYVELCDAGWKEPVNLGSPINTGANEFYPSITRDNVLYYTASYEGNEDIYRSRMIGGKFNKPQRLGDAVNSESGEFNAFISLDETYLIFSSFGREDGFGGGDLYISFKNDSDDWTKAINMGERFNSSRLDYCPYISFDGKYFFFTSSRLDNSVNKLKFQKYNDIVTMQSSPGNGNDDIYWVLAETINKLKAEK